MTAQSKLAKLRDITRGGGGFTKQEGIFFTFQPGTNKIRLVGEPLTVHTHFIAPVPKRGDPGLCDESEFHGDNALHKSINCPNWDIEAGKPTDAKTCPICRLNAIARELMNDKKATPEQREEYSQLKDRTRVSKKAKWNIIDRTNPYITERKPDGTPNKVRGFKVADIGADIGKDVEGIFSQLDPRDPCGVEDGCDIVVERYDANNKTSYTARADMKGGQAAPTPLTDEEKAMPMVDLRRVAGKVPDAARIIAALRQNLRDLLDTGDETAPESLAAAPTPAVPAAEEPADESDGDDDMPDCFGGCDDPTHPECSKCVKRDACVAKFKATSVKKRGK